MPFQLQKQTANSKFGLSSCRESHRQKEANRKEFVSCRIYITKILVRGGGWGIPTISAISSKRTSGLGMLIEQTPPLNPPMR